MVSASQRLLRAVAHERVSFGMFVLYIRLSSFTVIFLYILIALLFFFFPSDGGRVGGKKKKKKKYPFLCYH